MNAVASSLAAAFAALKYRNFRLWFIGQSISLAGVWMQMTAQGYLIYELTHSTEYLGYVGFAAGAPSLLLILYGGVVSDRMSRRTLLILTQCGAMAAALVLAGLCFAGVIRPWHILVIAGFAGVINAFDAPARQAFVRELVNHGDMSNAIALNSALFTGAMAVGPALAGIVYVKGGPAWCFAVNGLSYVGVIAALVAMRGVAAPERRPRVSSLDAVVQGLRYVAAHPVIRVMIVIVGVTSLLGISFLTLVPAWAKDILGGDAQTNGWLQSARGVGSLLGALMVAALGQRVLKGRLVLAGTLVFPAFLVVFAIVRALPLSLLAILGVGWGFMVSLNALNTLIQTHVADELRGRVMGLYGLVFYGAMPVGSLIVGHLAAATGAPLTVLATGVVGMVFALWMLAAYPALRRME
jgi:MFS family permease